MIFRETVSLEPVVELGHPRGERPGLFEGPVELTSQENSDSN